MPAIAIAALGALIVAMIYETNKNIGGPLLTLVILALLLAAFKAGNLSYTGVASTFTPPNITIAPGFGTGGG